MKKTISILILAIVALFSVSVIAHEKVVVIPLGGKCKKPTGPTKIIFLSSQSYTGNLGGLAGADAKCQQLADNAGLSGTYKAWLSVYGFDPITRIIPSTAPYVRTDGAIIANNFDDLTDGSLEHSLQHPIMLDEHGQAIASPVWTDTGSGGWGYDDQSRHCQVHLQVQDQYVVGQFFVPSRIQLIVKQHRCLKASRNAGVLSHVMCQVHTQQQELVLTHYPGTSSFKTSFNCL